MTMERFNPRHGLISRRPFRDLDELQRRFEDLMPVWPSTIKSPFGNGEWVPAVDMYEKDDNYVVKAELPGMKEDDIDISVAGSMLTIKGDKKEESEVKEENYYRSERSYGSFSRSIELPSNTDADKISANFEDGVLEVEIPKTENVKPKKINVSSRSKKNQKSS